jgi:hypothetical protein
MMTRAVPWAVAAVLVGSATLKAITLWAAPTAHLGTIVLPRWLAASGIGLEVALAMALILARRSHRIQGAAMALFIMFTVIAAWLTWMGAASCGCFGKVMVPPWATLVLDLGVVGALAWNLRQVKAHVVTGPTLRPWHSVTAVGVGLALAATLAVHHPDRQQTDIVVGNKLEAHATEPIDVGEWIVVCYRSDCPHCAASIGDWLEWAALDLENNGRRWAFLNLDEPHAATDLLDRYPQAVVARWRKPMPYLATPLVLALQAGVVTKTSSSVEDFFADLPTRPTAGALR